MPQAISLSLADLRAEYTRAGLSKEELDADPLRQFQKWFEQALKSGMREPNAMTLATVDAGGQPSIRIVLLKGVDERGFTFFTNYQSRKALELARNPRAALNFPWIELERQVNVLGAVARLSKEESQAYFRTRPRGNQLGAWASEQSAVISDREVLEKKMQELELTHAGRDVAMPPFWGGYVVAPNEIEFWQGRPNRLHDRFRYTLQSSRRWKIERLSP